MEKVKKNNRKTLLLLVLIGTIILALVIAGIFLLKGGDTTYYAVENQTTSQIGQSSRILGTVERTKPIVSDGGLDLYPTYGTNIKNTATTQQMQNIINENNSLLASSSTYDSMDEYGNLYLNGSRTGKVLYKHSASTNMYYGDVSDDEVAVIKEITIKARQQGNYITGLYAPAGEVIKIEISQNDLENTNGLRLSIGQISQTNELNNVWIGADSFNRMPVIANTMSVNSTTAYVGFHLGGPIYVTPNNSNCTFTIKISGAVEYLHYIHGLTTKEEYESMQNLSAPYFDLEIWDTSVRHSGPKIYAPKDFESVVKVATLWENISRISTQVPNSSRKQIGITFIYDPFIAAAGAAAVAFVGRNWCNLPTSWMSGSLNYDTFVTSGMWGTIHEFNHHYQSYGIDSNATNEVTNNATSLLSYVLYTNISAMRSLSDSTLTGWNRFTDASRSLRETISNSASQNAQDALNIYADIIHAFGVDKFIQATKFNNGARGVDNWYTALCETMHYDFSYYFSNLLNQKVSQSLIDKYSSYPTFVPVATIFQIGRNYYNDNNEVFVETMRPYEINYGESLVMDFNERLILPSDFSFEITDIAKPKYGTLTKTSDNVYTYTPDENTESGTFYITLKLHNEKIETPDVTISINIKQSGKNATATRYTYSPKIYTTTSEALENNFAGYETTTQNYTKSHFMNGLNNGSIGVVEGKIYIPSSAEYTICFRAGRGNHSLYLSVNDDLNYQNVVILTGNHPNFVSSGEQTYKLELNAGDYLYFKEITVSNGNDAYMELGWAYGTNAMASIPTTYVMGNKGTYGIGDFSTPTYYTKTNVVSQLYPENLNASIISTQGDYGHWDNLDQYKIENILSSNEDLQFHSKRNYYISEDNPFGVTVDMGNIYRVNKFIISKYTGGQIAQMPTKFELYGGRTLEDMQLLGNYDINYTDGNVEVTFNETNIRYYTLLVYDTNNHQYVAMKKVDMCLDFNGEEISPDRVLYSKYEKIYTQSTYGHVNSTSGKVKIEFEGTQFGIYTNQNQNVKLEIEIDNKKYNVTIDQLNKKHLAFLSETLSAKKHTIIITVKRGTLNLESIIIK